MGTKPPTSWWHHFGHFLLYRVLGVRRCGRDRTDGSLSVFCTSNVHVDSLAISWIFQVFSQAYVKSPWVVEMLQWGSACFSCGWFLTMFFNRSHLSDKHPPTSQLQQQTINHRPSNQHSTSNHLPAPNQHSTRVNTSIQPAFINHLPSCW